MSAPQDTGDEALRARLRALRRDPPSGGFASSLHRRLVEAGPPDRPAPWRRWWTAARGTPWAWPAVGLAAGVAVFLGLSVVRAPAPGITGVPAPEAVARVRVPSTRVALVRVNLTTDVAVASADLEVRLPDGLVFWSEGAPLRERSFAWQQPLAAGSNEIPIAVRGERPGLYHVQVVARVGDEQIVHDVALEVVKG